MREDKHLDAGRVRKLGGTERRRVQGLVGPLLLFRCERRLVNQHVGVASSLEHLARGTRVTGERELASVTGRTENLVGAFGCLRFAETGVTERRKLIGLFRLDVGRADHLAPLLGVV